jgi:hypothetical protein
MGYLQYPPIYGNFEGGRIFSIICCLSFPMSRESHSSLRMSCVWSPGPLVHSAGCAAANHQIQVRIRGWISVGLNSKGQRPVLSGHLDPSKLGANHRFLRKGSHQNSWCWPIAHLYIYTYIYIPQKIPSPSTHFDSLVNCGLSLLWQAKWVYCSTVYCSNCVMYHYLTFALSFCIYFGDCMGLLHTYIHVYVYI